MMRIHIDVVFVIQTVSTGEHWQQMRKEKPNSESGQQQVNFIYVIKNSSIQISKFQSLPKYIATILKTDQSNSLYFQSGAVLISDMHILTTAHTIQSLEPQSLVVRLGEWDTQNTNEFLPHFDYK